MTRSQRVICILLCLCMFAGFWAYFPGFFIPVSAYRMLPLMSYCDKKVGEETLTEDARTYQAIVEANQNYLAQQVTGENAKEQEQQETVEQQEEKEEVETPLPTEAPAQEVEAVAQVVDITREQLENNEYLLNHFFIVDSNTATSSDQINASALLDKDMTIPADSPAPQILIYHSHSQEGYVDSREGDGATSVVAVGETLVSILKEKYGYGVLHVTDAFDVVDGQLDRNSAYDYAREKVEQVLAENPSIQVVIDLHRDGVPEEKHLVTEINGQPTAQVMLYNGLSYSAKNGPIEYLPNPHVADNLAFSFQLKLAAEEYYPGFSRPVYLSSLRYNLHLKPRAILLEVGAQNNTLQEAKNAMEPFAWILHHVLE